MAESKYLVDSNIFLTPYHSYYQFLLAPSFWRQFNSFVQSGNIVVIDKVREELCISKKQDEKDDLQIWVENAVAKGQYLTNIAPVLVNYAQVIQHINNSEVYNEKALRNWANAKVADPWLVSVGMETGHTVVSLEAYNKNLNSKNPSSNPKLPNVCEEFGVKYITLYDMMRELKFSL